MDAILLLSDETSIAYNDCMAMPTNIFLVLCNKTVKLIKDRNENEKKEAEKAKSSSGGYSIPAMPSMPAMPQIPSNLGF